MRYMYHATHMSNLLSIMDQGIHPGPDKIVYMCEDPRDAAKFLAIRLCKDILVCKIKILKADEDKIIETFDHSERFFKCRAFGYTGTIPSSMITEYIQFKL